MSMDSSKITYERFTDRSRKAMQKANSLAILRNRDQIEPVFILWALIDDKNSIAGKILNDYGITDKNFALLPSFNGASCGRIPLSASSESVVKGAIEVANELNHTHIGTEHLLLSIINNLNSEIVKAFGQVDAASVKHCVLLQLKQFDKTTTEFELSMQQLSEIDATVSLVDGRLVVTANLYPKTLEDIEFIAQLGVK